MGYRFEHGESVSDGVRRIAGEQLDSAVDDLVEVVHDDPPEAVHDCRKRCKKVRALIRVVRPAIGDERYRAVNDSARDAARELSVLRDATAIHETYRRLLDISTPPDGVRAEVVDLVGDLLAERRAAVETELSADHPAIDRARALLDATRLAIDEAAAALDDGDDWELLGPGIVLTYRRARRAMAAAIDEPTGERFHEWRKRVKYGWYHVRLVEPAAPALLGRRADVQHDLAGALGDAHDMVVLSNWLRSDDPGLARLPDLTPVHALVGSARSSLEAAAVAHGRTVFAERPKHYGRRLGGYWSTWRQHGGRPRLGDLEDVLDR
jgi:CHAD domain-containing protein